MATTSTLTLEPSLAGDDVGAASAIRSDKPFLVAAAFVLFVHLGLSQWLYQLFLTQGQLFTRVLARLTGIELGPITLIADAVYHQWSILLAALAQPAFAVVVLATVAVPVFFRKDLRWAELDRSGRLRLAVTALSLVLIWQSVTYDYNLFLDRWHLADRGLVLCLALLVWRHPGFVAPLLIAAFTMLSSIRYPLDWLSITDRRLLFDALILFSSCCVVWAAIHRGWLPRPVRLKPLTMFLFLLLCLIGASYFQTAVKKVWISPHGWEWFWTGELAFHTAACVARGWLAVLSEPQRSDVVHLVETVQRAFLLGALLIETCGFFTVFRRRVSIAMLGGAICLHLGIFAASGILFWKWIAVDLVAIGLLYKLTREESDEVFQGRRLVAVAIMLLAPLTFMPVMLGWFDTPLHTHFELQAVGASGKVYTVDKALMDPYDMYFQFDRFVFLVDRPLLGNHGSQSTSDYGAAEEIIAAGPEGIEPLRRAHGVNYFDAEQARVFDDFIARFFKRLNQYGGKPLAFGPLSPLHHIYAWSPGPKFDGQEPVALVRVRFVEAYYDGQRDVVLFDEIVREIPIEAHPTGHSQEVGHVSPATSILRR